MASTALNYLGIGDGTTGAALAEQVDETSEEAKKRKRQQQAQDQLVGRGPALASLGIGVAGYGTLGGRFGL